MHADSWSALASEKREVVPAIEASLARVSTPLMMHNAAAAYRKLGDKTKAAQLEEKILAQAPASFAAQIVMRDRVFRALDGDGDALAVARAFVAWPHHYDAGLRTHAHYLLYGILDRDGKGTNEELLSAIRGMLNPRQPSRYAAAAVELADRKFALDEAERLAREGMIALERQLDVARRRGTPNDEFAARHRAVMHDALGWVLMHRGRETAALDQLQTAWKLNPRSPLAAYHLGRLYESQRQLSKAESTYRAGLRRRCRRRTPTSKG